jgi:hypothetical protein
MCTGQYTMCVKKKVSERKRYCYILQTLEISIRATERGRFVDFFFFEGL